MAVAEARAAWQRAVNRCLVQEDAKRAPKLACCPTASSALKHVDAGPVSADDAKDDPSIHFLPLNRSSSYSNLSPNSRWWLQIQPSYACQRNLTIEHLSSLEAEMETDGKSDTKSTNTCEHSEENDSIINETTTTESPLHSPILTTVTCVKNDFGAGRKEVKGVLNKTSLDPVKHEERKSLYELREKGPASCTKQAHEQCNSENLWIGVEKPEPWWRTADRDELALLVAQRSFDLVNCDLPQPQKAHIKKDIHVDHFYFDGVGIYASSMDPKSSTDDQQNLTLHKQGSCTSESACLNQWELVGDTFLPKEEKFSSDRTAQKLPPKPLVSDADPSKSRLLEALRHSQTRAREAENAAKQAFAEKEHIVKLVFRQASQIFAYKQWFQILQLENLYFQIRSNKNQPISTLFPVMLPWIPQKTRKLRKNWQKPARGKRAKRGRPRYYIGKYAVVFALGLSLVGAGLLLGCTAAWLFPNF